MKALERKVIVSELLHYLHVMGCNMSLKLHFLHFHLDLFPKNLGAVSDEHGERFHQEISAFKNHLVKDGMQVCLVKIARICEF